MDRAAQIAAYERQFRRSGLPLFIEGHSPATAVFNRALPLLIVVFVAECSAATSLDWSVLANVGAALGGLAILVAAYGIANRLRSRRFFARPDRAGGTELAVFVLVPALLPLLTQGQWHQVIGIAAGNLALLLVLYAVIGLGLLPTLWWSISRLAGELSASLTQLARALPVLLVFSIVLFVNTEMWQVFSGLGFANSTVIDALFVLLILGFVLLRVPAEIRGLAEKAAGPPLRRREKFNLGGVLVMSQLVQIAMVSLGMLLFFVAFGSLTISDTIYESWSIKPGSFHETWHLGDVDLRLTSALFNVAAAIAEITGLYYALQVTTDATFRENFVTSTSDHLERAFEARAEYRALDPGPEDHPPGRLI
ncbi:hypothetical protein [Luteipulveratus mongoliensis]|uniref:Integral membrane protein n=1 Tax=Luteipulveratus mongoliensis TaxID=571913 RepID=A0A0K1JPC9_9MICO|nr:hypothetical protein [Luteipulveratus mongoliensis]AKU18425.1 hypothetical protein VV02_25530 [Luteipulveratus mongoliensis]